MKRFLLTTIAAVTSMSSAYAAEDEFFFKPYVGADYQYNYYGNEDFGAGVKSDDIMDTGLHGGNIHAGARVHKYLGAEFGYFQTQEGSKDLAAGIESNVKIKGATLDVLGYLPVAERAELIGTVGVSYAKADMDVTGLGSDNESEWKPRLGAGAQYWLTDNLNARGLLRYQWADFKDSVDNAVIASIGVNWQF